jgi:SAM-dependent methyltransferase
MLRVATTATKRQYDDPYKAFLRCTAASQGARELALGHVFAQLRPSSEPRGLDVGAGSGDAMAWMLERLPGVALTGVEPDARLCRALEARFCGNPAVTVVQATAEAWLRGPGAHDARFDIALLLHVLYHVPQAAWAELLSELDARVSPPGVLVVSLQGPDSDYGRMIRHFGGEPLDVVEFFAAFRPPGRHVVEVVAPWHVRAGSIDELEPVLMFMLADILWETPPAAADVRRYAEEHFCRADGRFELAIPDHLFLVTRSGETARRLMDGSPLPARCLWAGGA